MLADIVARWPGSTHDSHICRTSAVGGNLEGTGGVLHGNGGYACSPFLVTLYLNPKTPQEEHSTEHTSSHDVHGANFWIVEEEILCATLRSEDGS